MILSLFNVYNYIYIFGHLSLKSINLKFTVSQLFYQWTTFGSEDLFFFLLILEFYSLILNFSSSKDFIFGNTFPPLILRVLLYLLLQRPLMTGL